MGTDDRPFPFYDEDDCGAEEGAPEGKAPARTGRRRVTGRDVIYIILAAAFVAALAYLGSRFAAPA
jgi:hypothetical protein